MISATVAWPARAVEKPFAWGHLAAHLEAGPWDERLGAAGEKSLLLCDSLGDSGLAAPNGLGYRGSATRTGGDGSRFCSLSSLICCRTSSLFFRSLDLSRFSLCSSRHLRLWDLLSPGGVFGIAGIDISPTRMFWFSLFDGS